MPVASFPGSEIATVSIDGVGNFSNWAKLRVNFTYNRGYAEFQFESVEPSDIPLDQVFRITPFMNCQIILGGAPVINGVVEIRESSYDANQHGLMIYGRDYSKNACDCSVQTVDGFSISGTFTSIGQTVLSGTGVGLVAPGDSGVVFPYFQVQPSETPWEVLERLARYQPGMRMRSDGFGTIHAENADSLAYTGVTFIEGKNILASSARLDITRSMNQQIATGQMLANDSVSSQDAAEQTATAPDPTVDGRRVQVTVAEEPITPALIQNRAFFERGVVLQEVVEVTVKVYGWFDANGNTYDVGRQYGIYSPMHALNRVLSSREVTFEQSNEEGTTTTIVLCTPESMSGVLSAANALPPSIPPTAVTTSNALELQNPYFGQGMTQGQIANPSPSPSSAQPAK